MAPTRPRADRRSTRGISTIEMLAAVGITLTVLATVHTFHLVQTRAIASQNTYAESQGVTRTVIDLMTRELRMATYDPTDNALANSSGTTCPSVNMGIVAAEPHKIHFQQDLNGDGLLTASGEDITYDVLGDQIRRTDGTSLPVDIVGDVPFDGLIFRYFDNSQPPVQLVPSGTPPVLTPTQRNCVAKVEITIRASIANSQGDPLESTVQSEVAIRNRSLVNF